MTAKGDFPCEVASPSFTGETIIHIGAESLQLCANGRGNGIDATSLDYADIHSFGLLNHHLVLDTESGRADIAKLGHDTEGCYEELADAFAARTRKALFVEGTPLLEAEGIFEYRDEGGAAQGSARVCLFPDCICLLPANDTARRIPLCFIERMEREDYAFDIALDTGERYHLARLGHETAPLHERASAQSENVKAAWARALAEVRMQVAADTATTYAQLEAIVGVGNMHIGLFEPSTERFWFAAVGREVVAVELVTGEKAATFCYRLPDASPSARDAFLLCLNHAMEAVGTHREMITMEDADLQRIPLYRMALARSSHLRFLRANAAERIIHTASWAQRMEDVLLG